MPKVRSRPRRPPRRTATASLLLVLTATASGELTGQEGLPEPVPLATIGCALCSGPRAFGLVTGLALSSDGTLVVLDRDDPKVRVFGPRGHVLAAFGREGSGPGELRVPAGVAVTAGGQIVVADLRNGTLVRYDRDGVHVGTRRAGSMITALQGGPRGRWVTFQEPHWTSMSAGVILLDSALSEVGTLIPDTRESLRDAEGEPAAPGLFSSAPGPDGRVALGVGDRYLIRVLGPEGRLLHEIHRDVERPARTSREIEAILERRRRGAARRGGDHPEAGALDREVDPLHPHFHARNGLAYDGGGRLWVRTSRGGPGATVFDLFGPGGGYLGEVPVTPAVTAFALGGGLLAGVVEEPDTGIQRVRTWRLSER